MPRELIIDGTRIADDTDCFVIAEIGHNHQGSLDTCIELFRAAKAAGATAVKLQKRDNGSLYTREVFDSAYNSENAYGSTYGLHRLALEFGTEQYTELSTIAADLGIVFFATAFDPQSVDFLLDIGVPALKIASGDLKSTHLLKYAASTGKPLIVSTGAATLDDVRRAHDTIGELSSDFALLQCTATYPPEWDTLDLRVIETYRREFPNTVVGYSGHDSGIAMATAAYALGARIVEKHFTLNRAMRGTDHALSLEPTGLGKLVRDLRRTRAALGDGVKRFRPEEQAALNKMGKKIVAARTLQAGHILKTDDLAMKSPGDGIAPCDIDSVVGRHLQVDVTTDEAIHFEMLGPQARHGSLVTRR